MTLFDDRLAAGKALARAIKPHMEQLESAIVIGLPRGGVVVAHEIALALQLPLDIVCPRKIGAPHNPEYAIGAITETGEGVFFSNILEELHLSESYIKEAIEKEKKQAQWRVNHYRKGRPPRNVKGKAVILVDDGLATGSTVLAAIKTMRHEQASKILLAIPVAPIDTLEKIKKEVEIAICLATPTPFFAVGQFYKQFDQTTDETVIALLKEHPHS